MPERTYLPPDEELWTLRERTYARLNALFETLGEIEYGEPDAERLEYLERVAVASAARLVDAVNYALARSIGDAGWFAYHIPPAIAIRPDIFAAGGESDE